MKNIKFTKGDYATIKGTGEVVRIKNPDFEVGITGRELKTKRVKVVIEHHQKVQDLGMSKYQWAYQSKLKAHKPTEEQLKEWHEQAIERTA